MGHSPGGDRGAGARRTADRAGGAHRGRRRRGRRMKGKWAAGIPPRNFAWVIKDRLAVSERPGGYARTHRRVRRQEEIIWIREQGFSRVVSLLASPHNLHAYDELGVAWEHVPLPSHIDAAPVLSEMFPKIRSWLAAGDMVLVHQEELGDRV